MMTLQKKERKGKKNAPKRSPGKRPSTVHHAIFEFSYVPVSIRERGCPLATIPSHERWCVQCRCWSKDVGTYIQWQSAMTVREAQEGVSGGGEAMDGR